MKRTTKLVLIFLIAILSAFSLGVASQLLPSGPGSNFIVHGSNVSDLYGHQPLDITPPSRSIRIWWDWLLYSIVGGVIGLATVESLFTIVISSLSGRRIQPAQVLRFSAEGLVILATSFAVFLFSSDPLRNAFF